jgi:hypothetical protein
MYENEAVGLGGELFCRFQIGLPEQAILCGGEARFRAQQPADQNGGKRGEMLFTQSEHGENPCQQNR